MRQKAKYLTNMKHILKNNAEQKSAGRNSTFAIGEVSYSSDSLVVAESLVLHINIYGKNRQLLLAAKRQTV